MIRGTTPTHTFTLPIEISALKDFVITYCQHSKIILEKKKDECTVSDNVISVSLSQEDTLMFEPNFPVEMQIKVLTNADKVLASKIKMTTVDRILNEEVLV